MDEIKKWKPVNNPDFWIKNGKYEKYKDVPNFELEITNSIIEDAKKYIKPVNDNEEKYTIVIKIFNDNMVNITNTTNDFYNGIVCGLYYKLFDTVKTKNISAWDVFENYIGVKCKILDIYKGTITGMAISKIKNELLKKEELYDKNNQKKENIKKNYNEKVNIFDKYININLPLKIYYIYKIYDLQQQYICGSFKKYNNETIIHFVDALCIDINKIMYDILEEIQIRTETEGLYCVDKYISKYDSINNGLNLFFNIQESEYFRSIQRDIMNIKYNDLYDYYKGLIASIEYDNKYYIFMCNGDKTIKNHLNYLYSLSPNTCPTSYKSIVELLNKINYTNLKIKILEKYIDDCDLYYKFEYYKNKLNSYENGYNVVNNFDIIIDKINDINKKTYLNTMNILKNNQSKTFYKKI